MDLISKHSALSNFENSIKKEKKILFAFLIELCIMFIMTILPLLKSAAAPVFFYLVLFSSLLLGIMTAILQDGLFGIVSHFPFMYTQSLMAGQGLAGLSSSISNILSTTIRLNGTMEDSESIGVVVYFAISLLIIIAALGCFVVVWKSSMYQTLLHGKISEICDDSGRVCDEDNESNNSLATVNKTSPGANSELEIISPLYLSSTSHSVFHHIKYHAIAVFWIFMVTLSVFPGLIASTVSSRAETEQGSFEKNYFIAFSFLLFDIGDVIGKVLPGFHFFLITNPIWNRLGAVFRTIFIPLLMSANLVFINTKMEKIPIYWTSFVQNDATFYLILLAFAISNGYFGSTLMMTGPGLVPDISKRGLAGSLMALWLTAGLAVGSVLAFAVKAILIHDNPFVL